MGCCRQILRNFLIKFERLVTVLLVHRAEQIWEILCTLLSSTKISTRSWLTCAGMGEEGGGSCTAGRAVCCLPTLLIPPAALPSCPVFPLSICWSLTGQNPPPWWISYIECAGLGQSSLICGGNKYKGALSEVSNISLFAVCFVHRL